MKLLHINIVLALILLMSCNTKKEVKTNSNDSNTEIEITDNETSIEDIKWKLITFMGNDIADKNLHITFSSKDNKVYGNAGCNNFSGTYELEEGYRLELSKLISTKMACPDMSIETEFLAILEKVDNYSINGTKMTLNKAKMAPYATFKAIK